MRRRITDVYTGLGNPKSEKFDNKYTSNKMFNMNLGLFFCDVLKEIDDLSGGFDFKIYLKSDGFVVMFGIDPSYKHDPYICYCLDSNKESSYIHKGHAAGYYGSNIQIDKMCGYNGFSDKYKAIIDKHLDKLTGCLG